MENKKVLVTLNVASATIINISIPVSSTERELEKIVVWGDDGKFYLYDRRLYANKRRDTIKQIKEEQYREYLNPCWVTIHGTVFEMEHNVPFKVQVEMSEQDNKANYPCTVTEKPVVEFGGDEVLREQTIRQLMKKVELPREIVVAFNCDEIEISNFKTSMVEVEEKLSKMNRVDVEFYRREFENSSYYRRQAMRELGLKINGACVPAFHLKIDEDRKLVF